jgi:AsmA protein
MKKWLIRIAAVLLVIVVILLVLPFVIPVAWVKDQIVAQVKSATGRDFAINGSTSLSFLPSIAIELNDVSFGNPPGMSDKTMVRLAKLQLKVKVLPLLSRELAIDSFVLVDPKIGLEVDKQGRPNWQLGEVAPPPAAAASGGATAPKPATPAPATSAAPTSAASAKPAASALEEAHLGDVRLVNGTITYVDDRTGQKQQVDKINAKLALPDLGSPMQVSGSVDWNSKTIELAFDLAQPRQFLAGEKSPVTVKVSAPTIKFDFKGNVASAKELTLAGDTSLDIPSIRDLAVWTSVTLPATSGGLKLLKIDGKLDLAGSKVAFSGAQLVLDAINAKGDFAVDATGAKPYLKGTLDIDKLDLNPYLPPEGGKPAASTGAASTGAAPAGAATGAPAPAAGKPAAASSGWSDAPIDTSGLGLANADFALSTGGIVFHKITIGKSVLAIHLKDGKLDADLSQMELYSGSGTGKIGLDGSGAAPVLQADFDLAKVQAEPLLRDSMDMDRLSGNLNGNITVAGHGRSQRELIGNLNGKGAVHFADGSIKGIDIGALVHNAVTALIDSSSQKNDQTAFSEMGGTFTITNGIVDNKDLELKSPLLRVAGAGTIDLPQRTVNYRIEPKVALTTQGQGGSDAAGLTVPVVVQGPWDNLSYRPQLDGLLKQPGQALQGLKGLIPNAAPGGSSSGGASPAPNPGAVLKGLFGTKP